MKNNDKIVENQDLHSLYHEHKSNPENMKESESDRQKREEIFIDLHDRFSENFWNLMQKFPLKELMDRLERTILISALSKFEGNQRKTAKFLSMKPTTLYEKIKKYKILFRKIPYKR